jgi:hypothetical protein
MRAWLRTFRTDQQAKSVSILRTGNTQIGS